MSDSTGTAPANDDPPKYPPTSTTRRWGDPAIVRILDANANRALEGLRVIEEYARFLLEDVFLTAAYKELRHDLVATLAAVPERERLLARETRADVGTTIAANDEYARGQPRDIAAANHKRVEQALRCLEEYSKIESPELAARVEGLRYRAYTLARALHIGEQSRQQLAGRHLYVLIDGCNSALSLASFGQQLAQAGVHLLQLRDKSLSDRELLTRARSLRAATRDLGTLLILNDRPDLALLADADGVHLGQEDVPVKEARALLGPDRLIGVSAHSLSQACQAVLEGANYLGCGPTFPSTTKQFSAFPGTEFLRAVHSRLSLPAFAIGGIQLDNLDQVLATGIARVAVSGAVTHAHDPVGAVRQFLARLTPVASLHHPSEAIANRT
jgi:thiamine-phosphate pyrophosphorylase